MQKFDPSVYVHSPADLGAMHVEHAEFIKAHPGITFGVPCVDRYVIPQRPGDMTIIVGRPGSGKTSLLARQAKRTAEEIMSRNAQLEECVIYVSWEQHAEELEAYFEADNSYTVSDYAWGRVDMDDVRAKAFKRAHLPLWMIGHSRKNVLQQSKPMTLSVVFQAIESMVYTFEKAPKPVLLCFDYAQLIPWEGQYHSRPAQVKAAINATKQLALRVGCPVMVAAQATRDVDRYKVPIPTMNDAQESSGLEQVTDKMFGIWRPWKTQREEKTVTVAPGYEVQNCPELFVLRMVKQRLEDGDRTFILHFDMGELRLAELELEREPELIDFY